MLIKQLYMHYIRQCFCVYFQVLSFIAIETENVLPVNMIILCIWQWFAIALDFSTFYNIWLLCFFVVALNVKNCLLIRLLALFIPWWVFGLKWQCHCGLEHHCSLLANQSVMYNSVFITYVAECLFFFIVQKHLILICTAFFVGFVCVCFILIKWDHYFPHN